MLDPALKKRVADVFLDGRAVAADTPFQAQEGTIWEFNRISNLEGMVRVKTNHGPRYFRIRISEME